MILVGLLLAKVMVSIVYFAETMKVPDAMSVGRSALAQDDTPAAEDPATADSNRETAPAPESGVESAAAPGAAEGAADEAGRAREQSFSDETRAALEGLEKKRRHIQEAERRLAEEERRLDAIKEEIEARIDELTKVQKQVEEKLARIERIETEEERLRREAEERRIKQLLKIYASMKPKDFVPIMAKLDFDDAMKIIKRMKSEQIGKILLNVDKDLAVKISNEIIAEENRKNNTSP
jgi:flagellar motility protein MotE (MotC chaperone)